MPVRSSYRMTKSSEDFKDLCSLWALKSTPGTPKYTLERAEQDYHRNLYDINSYLEGIRRFQSSNLPIIDNYTDSEIWKAVEAEMFQEFQRYGRQFKAKNVEYALSHMKDSDAGFGLRGRRLDSQNQDYIRAVEATKYAQWRSGSPETRAGIAPPYKGLVRTQLAKNPRRKVRMVLCAPMLLLCWEIMLADEALNRFCKNNAWYASGHTLPEQQVLINSVAGFADEGSIWRIDWPKFDLHVEAFELEFAMRCLALMLDMNDDRTQWLWKICVFRLIYKYVILPDGSKWRLIGSVPSGTLLTNFVDSLVNRSRLLHLAKHQGSTIYRMYICGDDSLTAWTMNLLTQAEITRIFRYYI